MAETTTENATMFEFRRFSLQERDRRWKAVRERMARDSIEVIIAPQNT